MNTRQRAPPRHANTVPGHSDARFCPGCGKSPHNRTECSAWGKICFKCDKRNHFANVCRYTAANTNLVVNVEQPLSQTDADLCNDTYALNLYNTNTQHSDSVKPYVCTINVCSTPVILEIDTGSSVTLLSHTEWARIKEKAPKLTLDTQNVPCLRTYSGHTIQPLGRTLLDVYHNDTQYQLYALVVPGTGPNLLGRDWLSVLQLNWAKVHRVDDEMFLEPYKDLFTTGLGKLEGVTAKLYVDETVQPRYCKPRPVPLAMRAKVESELDRLQEEGVIRPVEFSEWAAPIVPVLKASGDIRICGDYKVTINQAVKVDKYPIPNIDDLFTKVSGGQLFTTLDLRNAYQQVVLEEESRKLTTINTTKGLFEYVRLPYGVSSAPGIYQRIMEQLLQNIPMTVVYLDDILVSGSTPEEHDRNLRTVLTRLLDKGLWLRKEKCVFRQKSCRYLGHVIDEEGIHPTDDKVMAIKNAPVPQNVQQLRSYLGLIHYYHNFLSNISSLLAPLHELTRLDTEWKWGTIHQKAFEQSKALLSSSKVLAHYDPQLPIIVSSDASAYGIGSVLSHRMPDGSEKPVAFASRSLSPAEKKYAQLEKEALALIFGVTKFHKYLCGRSFTLQSDHRPLLGLLKQDRVISAMASARIQRWALTLSNYEYKLEYMPGSRISHADCMSRLPLPDAPSHVPVPQEVVLALSTLDETPINSDQIEKWTSTDPVLSQVRRFVEQGWSDQTPPEFDCYRHRKDELSVKQGVLFWGASVIIPPKGRDALLRELHDTHPGMVKMKALARSYLWWPGLDMEIERHVKDCNTCQIYSRQPPVAPLHPWEWPGRTWHPIHIDYAGPFEGRMLLIIVDAHSKFIDAHIVSSATTSVTLTKLRQTFSFTGLPHTIVSDNGSCFTSDEFEQFCRANGIKHVRCSPYHPSSNGAAERAVQTVKFGLRKTKGNLEDRLYTLLARYRVTPQGTTGRAPAEFMLKTPPQIRFDLLRPSVQDKVLEKQAYDKQRHDTHAAERTFMTGDSAWALNFQGKPKWMPTVIESQLGPLTFTVRLSDGRLWKRHQDHLRERRHDETESVGAAQPRPEVLLPPPPLPQLTSTDKEREVTPLTSATTSDSAPARVPESPAPKPYASS